MTFLNRESLLKLCECISELQLKICELCGYTNCGVKDGITKREREKLTDEELERDATMFLNHVRREVCLFSQENSKMKAILKEWREKHFDLFKRIDDEVAKLSQSFGVGG